MGARMRARLGRAVLAAALAFAVPAVAEPAPSKLPAATVMVVDVQAALQQSLASKSLRTQRDQYLQGFQSELEKKPRGAERDRN